MKKNIKKRGGKPLSEEIINDAIARASKEGYSDNIDSIYVHYCNEILRWRRDKYSKKHELLYIVKLKDGYETKLFQKGNDWFYYKDHNIFKLDDSNVPLIGQRRNEYISKIKALEQDVIKNGRWRTWYDDCKDSGEWQTMILYSSCKSSYYPYREKYAYDIYYRQIDTSKYEILILTHNSNDDKDIDYMKSMVITTDANELCSLSHRCDAIGENRRLSAQLYCYIRRLCHDWEWFEDETYRNASDEYSVKVLLYGLYNDDGIVKSYMERVLYWYRYLRFNYEPSNAEKDCLRAYNKRLSTLQTLSEKELAKNKQAMPYTFNKEEHDELLNIVKIAYEQCNTRELIKYIDDAFQRDSEFGAEPEYALEYRRSLRRQFSSIPRDYKRAHVKAEIVPDTKAEGNMLKIEREGKVFYMRIKCANGKIFKMDISSV